MLSEGVSVLSFFRKLLDSGTPCLTSLFVVNAMSFRTAYKSATIICLTGAKAFSSGRVNFKV